MERIELPDEWVEAKGEVASVLTRIYATVYGNGKDGLEKTISDFLLIQRTESMLREKLEKDHHSANKRLLERLTLAVGILGLFAAILTAYVGWKEYQAHWHASIPALTEQYSASVQQDSTIAHWR